MKNEEIDIHPYRNTMFENIEDGPVIAWWSGGITSAVACKIAQDWFGGNIRFVMIDTMNEDDDTYRFKKDCERWYSQQIEVIKSEKYDSIQQVWERYSSLNVANGAVCSSELKRKVRHEFQKNNKFSYQVFGFDTSEINRAKSMKLNHKDSAPIFPLIYQLITKKDCINMVQEAGIEPPNTYKLGFSNNNCFKTGCVQGGIGYWQKMRRDFPEKFEAMALMEHSLTNNKGIPVTMLKDQSKNGGLVFLKPHPSYPEIKDISMMKGVEPKPLMECNGFCGTNELDEKSDTENEINYQESE